MTQQEQASLDILRTEVNAGFREIRDLMEVRRIEEVRVQAQLDQRVQKVERVVWLVGIIATTSLVVAGAVAQHFIQ